MTATLPSSDTHTDFASVDQRQSLPPIYFYIPQAQLPPQGIPDDIDAHWQVFGPGVFAWTLQTYLRLKQDGFPCQFAGTIPEEGIIVAHRDSISCNWRPSPRQFFVCIQSDRTPHPWAQMHVVHNPQCLLSEKGFCIESSYYIPHWAPQPGLIPRDVKRGDRFETIAFFGHPRNLAPELKHPDWEAKLTEMGLRWQIVSSDRWNDYSEVDAVIAVRSFDEQPYEVKPALKLYNAWHAGVPAILGFESAFRAERKSDLDYLEVRSITEAIDVVQRLRDHPALRRTIIDNGRRRAAETRSDIHLKMWHDLLTGVAAPAYQRWRDASLWRRQAFLFRHSFALNIERIRRRTQPIANFFPAR